ncbi:helix-turn-helix domain-containing protein [Reinekea thalattae]|uniref:Helix-turn-helix domain-containing protein n=1 Tax=Reinekea thalattae TaxID=2593301 RepID=A0A5C8Z971_9GAMM|nr:XRE family transcriptional regulator [Reinekea thalattae]TXR54257.1 helix-turn-helix domain-containing protein [Reinekea thalattae]
MEINSESLRFVLGLKIKQFRQSENLSLKQLSQLTSLSISYLSEIEKGKKYPKPEKIATLAHALNRSFDDLVSLKLDDELNPLTALLESPVLKEFPLQQFGIGLPDIFELVNDSPSKAGAFIRTLLEISRGYDMNVEHFLLASLRSYQKMHLNYFADLEEAASSFRAANAIEETTVISQEWLENILRNEFGCDIQYGDFNEHPDLQPLRSISPTPKKIWINSRLYPQQQKFVLAREIGYRFLKLKERATTSSWIKVETFDQVFNHFKVSYFAGALLIPEQNIIADLEIWLQNSEFDGAALTTLMQKYDSTPEMFLYRMSQVMPTHFGLHKMHYMRLNHKLNSNSFHITKELNLTNVFIPRSIGPGEHQCRRWAATSGLKQLAEHPDPMNEVQVSAQLSTFVSQGQTFFNIAIVRAKSLDDRTNTGMTLGFIIDDNFKQKAAFWNDKQVPNSEVNETCERCPVNDCESRVAPPSIYNAQKKQRSRERSLAAFIERNQ